MNEWMDGWMNEGMDGWMNKWMNEWRDGWMNKWRDGWMNEWISESLFTQGGPFSLETSIQRGLVPCIYKITVYLSVNIMHLPYFSAYKSNRCISRPLIFGWKCVTFCHILHISRLTKLTCIHHKHSTFYWRNQQFFIQFYEERKLFKNSSCSSLLDVSHCGRIYFTVNESTLNFCNLLFSSFKKWHFKLEINRGNSLNFNDNTMSVSEWTYRETK